MKVVVAGAGIAGGVLLRQLRHRKNIEVQAYEKRSLADASPPGLNVLMNHNGLAAIAEIDPELYQAFQQTLGSCEMRNWSARTVSGKILYHLEDVVASGDASKPALVARWDHIHAATRCDELTEYSTQVVDVQEEEDGEDVKDRSGGEKQKRLKVKLLRLDGNGDKEPTTEWIRNVDMVVAADGRYSTVREKLAPATSYFGPPYITDFRIVVQNVADVNSYFSDTEPMWRVYQKPDKDRIVAKYGDHPAIVAAASGYVRVGVMKLGETTLGCFGNISIPGDGKPHDVIKNGEFLASLFQPAKGEEPPDRMGQFVIEMLREHGDKGHWTRKQQTDTCYQALEGRVLFIGDAAGAIYPSLGQGANLSLEDAAVAAACFPNVKLVSQLRYGRREFIKELSRCHAIHVADPDTFDREISNWADPSTLWRANLRKLWCCGQQLVIRSKLATKDNVAPFGQLISESVDGNLFNPSTTDAALDLSQGTPRFYLMKLTGGRPLCVDRITRHQKVTQCLGALGLDEPFYLVMHAPDDHPTLEGLQAFYIPPKKFIKLHMGTWHVGPLWEGSDDSRTFMNLELADTNEVDHDTVEFLSLPPYASPVFDGEKLVPLRVPVVPLLTDIL